MINPRQPAKIVGLLSAVAALLLKVLPVWLVMLENLPHSNTGSVLFLLVLGLVVVGGAGIIGWVVGFVGAAIYNRLQLSGRAWR